MLLSYLKGVGNMLVIQVLIFRSITNIMLLIHEDTVYINNCLTL